VHAREILLHRLARSGRFRLFHLLSALRLRGALLFAYAQRLCRHTLRDPLGRQRRGQAPPLEDLVQSFTARGDWEDFLRARPEIADSQVIEACARHVEFVGLETESGPVPGYRVAPACNGNYREGLRYGGLNCRKRALLYALFNELPDPRSAVVYAPEALSPMARQLARQLPGFIGSEYFTDALLRQRHATVRHENLAALSFEDDSIDRAVVGDVFEHVTDLHAVIGEIHRVLKPGGILYSTFPFAVNRDEHVVKARWDGERVDYLCAPEYHGDPVRPEGVLVFQIPGWQILDDCRRAGFGSASMRFISSCRRGILGSEVAGILLLRAEKAARGQSTTEAAEGAG